jgi:arylsulfatase A-like enzyme
VIVALRVAAAAACLASLACTAREPWRPPDIVVISVDTLRADRLPTYGYPAPTAPRIDALARESMVFDRAYAEAPHTLPSHASLFTGLYPGRHGMLDRGDTLAPSVPTLAELLAAQGYRTGGFTSCYFLTPEFRMERGFAHYEFAHDIESPRDAAANNRAILAWLDGLDGAAPFFLFAHYFDVHSDWDRLPYDAPDEYRKRFAGDPPAGFRTGEGGFQATRWLAQQNRSGFALTPDELRYVEKLYDAGVAWTDAQIGALLDALAQRGRLDRAIVVITADHGEEFHEHGKLLHSQVFDELLRIPLVVSLPEMRGGAGPACRPREDGAHFAPGRTNALAQHVDLLPTLAECLGVATPAGVQGRSLLGALAGGAGPRDAAFLDTPKGHQRGIVRDGWKLIEVPASGKRRLHHLDADPREQTDLAAREPARADALAAELAAHQRENEAGRIAGESLEVPEDVHEALEALGYLREEEPSK